VDVSADPADDRPWPETRDPGHTGEPEPRTRRTLVALGILAVLAQLVVAWFTVVLGLGWSGATYLVAVVQAFVAFGLIAWLLVRRRRLAALVPIASAALTVALLGVGVMIARTTACSDHELTLASELAPPPDAVVDFEGGMGGECVARFATEFSDAQVIAHYAAEFGAHGWRTVAPGVEGGPDQGIVGEKDGVTVEVVLWPEPEVDDAIYVSALADSPARGWAP